MEIKLINAKVSIDDRDLASISFRLVKEGFPTEYRNVVEGFINEVFLECVRKNTIPDPNDFSHSKVILDCHLPSIHLLTDEIIITGIYQPNIDKYISHTIDLLKSSCAEAQRRFDAWKKSRLDDENLHRTRESKAKEIESRLNDSLRLHNN